MNQKTLQTVSHQHVKTPFYQWAASYWPVENTIKHFDGTGDADPCVFERDLDLPDGGADVVHVQSVDPALVWSIMDVTNPDDPTHNGGYPELVMIAGFNDAAYGYYIVGNPHFGEYPAIKLQ